MEFEQALRLMKNGCKVMREGIVYSIVSKPTGIMFQRENTRFPGMKPSYGISLHMEDMLASDWELVGGKGERK